MIEDERLEQIIRSKNYIEHVPELLEGIQDLNWPNASRIVDFLKPRAREVYPFVKNVLTTNDEMWIYWVLSELVSSWPNEIVIFLEEDLIVLAENLDIFVETDLLSIEILLNNNLISHQYTRELLENKEAYIKGEIGNFQPELIDEFIELENIRIEILLTDVSQIVDYVKENSKKLHIKDKYEALHRFLKSVQDILMKLDK